MDLKNMSLLQIKATAEWFLDFLSRGTDTLLILPMTQVIDICEMWAFYNYDLKNNENYYVFKDIDDFQGFLDYVLKSCRSPFIYYKIEKEYITSHSGYPDFNKSRAHSKKYFFGKLVVSAANDYYKRLKKIKKKDLEDPLNIYEPGTHLIHFKKFYKSINLNPQKEMRIWFFMADQLPTENFFVTSNFECLDDDPLPCDLSNTNQDD